MIRRFLFWLHLALGVTAGAFIFIMAATGVVLAFQRQITDFADRDVRWTSVLYAPQSPRISDLLQLVRRSGVGDPSAIVVRNAARAATEFSIGRGKMIYVDPYSGAILGAGSAATRSFFSEVERLHRSLGAPLGSKGLGHWLAAISNLLFGGLILLGVLLWLPRKWSWQAVRASIAFRSGLGGRARHWNWHNVLGIWCALPLLVIASTGVVMSFPWANALLFQLSGSNPPAQGRGPREAAGHGRDLPITNEVNYDRLLAISKSFNPNWRTITLEVARNGNSPVQVVIDTGAGGQPQKRTQYLLNRDTGAVLKMTAFADGSLGQKLRSFVRFGHTGEWGGWVGQLIAAIASFAACALVYTGLSLSIRRLGASLTRKRRAVSFCVPDAERMLVK